MGGCRDHGVVPTDRRFGVIVPVNRRDGSLRRGSFQEVEHFAGHEAARAGLVGWRVGEAIGCEGCLGLARKRALGRSLV